MDLIFYILICLVLSAFFSGMEIAFMSANRLRIEIDKKQGNFSAIIASYFTKRPSEYIVTMLIANNLVLVIYSILFAKLLEPFFLFWFTNDFYVLLCQTLVSTLLILFSAEFFPKAVFRLMPNFFLNLLSVPVLLVYALLFPFTWLIIKFSNLLLRKKAESPDKNAKNMVFGRIDLDSLMNENKSKSHNELDTEHEIRIFQNALDFSKTKVRECMVPRPEIVAVDAATPVETIRQKFIETGFSKILVFENSIDNIVGYFSSKELFKKPLNLRSRIIKAPIVPETMNASKLLRLLLQEHKSIAVVVDEFGGTSGIVSTEDIMEEIFGEIEDEHDTNEIVEKQLSENSYIFSGKIEIEMLNSKYNLKIAENSNYDTLAGFIFYKLDRVPALNETFEIQNIEFKVLKTNRKRLDLIYVKLPS